MKAIQLKQRLQARVSIQVLDRRGRTVEARERDCDLVTNNWLQWAGASSLPFYNTNNLSLVDEYGGVRTLGISYLNYQQFSNPFSLPRIGIGNGGTPPAPEDFKLASEIARSGGLTPTIWTNPQTGRFEAVFFNTFATNLAITVSEVGFWMYFSPLGRNFLLARDLIDPPIQVPAGGAVKVTYSLVMAVVRA